ncbi:mycothiol transferase [Lentzea waywayandensis]|uniref:mycothiol transferase n=1 Tax=Lentzea waywayandensis TaxID=84724 RepID=UPI0015A70B29
MIAENLQHYPQNSRHSILSSLDGLAEHDVRRPLVPSDTNLLDLGKHLIGIEFGYLGDSAIRPAPITLPWTRTARSGRTATCGSAHRVPRVPRRCVLPGLEALRRVDHAAASPNNPLRAPRRFPRGSTLPVLPTRSKHSPARTTQTVTTTWS